MFRAVAVRTGSSSWLTSVARVVYTPQSGLLVECRTRIVSQIHHGRLPGAHPAELVQTGRGQARDRGQVVVREEPHHERTRLPAARDESAERTLRRRVGIRVDALRVVTTGELHDLVGIHRLHPEPVAG